MCSTSWCSARGKSRKNGKLGITQHLVDDIMDYLGKRGVSSEDEPMFMSKYNEGLTSRGVAAVVRYCMEKAGVYTKEKTAHSLRHTMAVQAIQCGVPIRELQVLLGHTDVKTTEIYLQSLDAEMRLKNSVVSAVESKLLRSEKNGQ